jgi:predicted dehydrogenase
LLTGEASRARIASVNNNEIRVAAVGAGAFGRNHARVYHELQPQGAARLAAVVDADGSRAKAIASPLGAQAFTSVSDMLAHTHVDAASVAVPTVHHLAVARELMERGVDVLIEKPVAQKHDRVAMVGHLERFNPAVRAALGVITQPMFFEVHRLSIFGPRALDVDVVLDLMIHDIDIVLTMTRSPVREVRAVGLPILSGKVDIANVRLEFESGCVANLTASRVSTERVRKLRLFQPRQYVSVDYTRQDVLVLTVNTDVLRSGAVNTDALTSLIKPEKPPVEQEEPLKAEIRAFLNAVRSRQTPAVTLEQGRAALKVALDVLAAIQTHSDRLGLAAMLR